jgi:hypothetical protein
MVYKIFNNLCGISDNKENIILAEMTFMVIGISIGVALLGLSITGFLFIRKNMRKNKYSIKH